MGGIKQQKNPPIRAVENMVLTEPQTITGQKNRKGLKVRKEFLEPVWFPASLHTTIEQVKAAVRKKVSVMNTSLIYL